MVMSTMAMAITSTDHVNDQKRTLKVVYACRPGMG